MRSLKQCFESRFRLDAGGFCCSPSIAAIQMKTGPAGPFSFVWRRGRDSNPRYVAVYTLSRRAPSTARTPLRVATQSSHTSAHESAATVAPFRAWRGLQPVVARGPERVTIEGAKLTDFPGFWVGPVAALPRLGASQLVRTSVGRLPGPLSGFCLRPDRAARRPG